MKLDKTTIEFVINLMEEKGTERLTKEIEQARKEDDDEAIQYYIDGLEEGGKAVTGIYITTLKAILAYQDFMD